MATFTYPHIICKVVNLSSADSDNALFLRNLTCMMDKYYCTSFKKHLQHTTFGLPNTTVHRPHIII
jgi:hypothetical protein